MRTNITILLATANRSHMLRPVFDSLRRQSLKPDEIIILDQSFDKKTENICRDYLFTYVKLFDQNKSKAINEGIHKSISKYIAIIDDDCLADERWVENLVRVFNETTTDIITGRVVAGDIEDNSVKSRLDDILSRRKLYKKGIITPIFILSGCNMAFNKEVVINIGGFDENLGPGSLFLSSDDNDWGYRVLTSGYKILYEPSAIVVHRSWRSTGEDQQQMQLYGYAAGAFFSKMNKISKLDYFYHLFKFVKWLVVEQIKCLFLKKSRQPFIDYYKQYVRGYRNMDKYINEHK